MSAIARRNRVSNKLVNQIKAELIAHGRVLSPAEVRANRVFPRGPGALSLDKFDQFTLMQLFYNEPERSLRSYKQWLEYYTGTIVSRATISRFFLEGFPYRGSLVKPNLVPWDKFRPANELRAWDYLEVLVTLNIVRVLFGDEKLLKGAEIFTKLVRVDPLTGERPACATDPDFRNTFTITGFCTVNTAKHAPLWFEIREETNNTTNFQATVCRAIEDGFFFDYDVLVVDNATYHNGLEELLWRECRVLVLRLPARCPEWNPKELVWNSLVQRMKAYSIRRLRQLDYGSRAVAYVARDILQQVTFEEVRTYFNKCYEFLPMWIRGVRH